MSHRRENKVIRFVVLALIFVMIAGGLYVSAGKGLQNVLEVKTRMAVESGAPIPDYTPQGTQPRKGELKKSEAALPSVGSCYGTIRCNRIDLNAPLYYGDTDEILSKGAGQYIGSSFPGEGRPILVGAHDIGYFAPLEEIEEGDIIHVKTSYGAFQYRVADTRIGYASDIGKKELSRSKEELILYTCYPFGTLTEEKARRYFVAAEKIEGPVLKEDLDESAQ